jgi:signal transduction histidine kinase
VSAALRRGPAAGPRRSDGGPPASPVDPPAGGRASALASHAWEGSFRPWDFYFAVVWVATELFALAAESPDLRVRVVSAALFALPVPWYVWARLTVLGVTDEDGPASRRYLTVLVLLYLPPAVLVGETRLAAFALVPQCFMLLRRGAALVAVFVVNVLPMVGWALLWRPEPHDLYYNALFAVVTLAFSLVVGRWIMRIIAQSEERADLVAELDASREQVGRLSAERGALAERERISREIHDTLAQGFTSLLMLVQAVQSEVDRDPEQARRHLALMEGTARDNLAEARALVAHGTPAGLDGGSLPDAVRRLAARQEEQTGEPAAVEITGAVRALPPAVEVVALRTCQEALANARRHAGPGAVVALGLDYTPRALRLSVRDTGCGFDPGRPARGYGLPGLRARAAEMGGTAVIRSAPGEGTTITVELPLADGDVPLTSAVGGER